MLAQRAGKPWARALRFSVVPQALWCLSLSHYAVSQAVLISQEQRTLREKDFLPGFGVSKEAGGLDTRDR